MSFLPSYYSSSLTPQGTEDVLGEALRSQDKIMTEILRLRTPPCSTLNPLQAPRSHRSRGRKKCLRASCPPVTTVPCSRQSTIESALQVSEREHFVQRGHDYHQISSGHAPSRQDFPVQSRRTRVAFVDSTAIGSCLYVIHTVFSLTTNR